MLQQKGELTLKGERVYIYRMPKPELKGRKTNKINYEGLYKSFQESCSNFNAYRMILKMFPGTF